MKKLNLIKRLLSYSHEKQKMGGMRRYAAMLMMLFTLGVGQMWASTTFNDGDVLFYDFTDVTGGGGVNWQCNSDMVYDPSGAGTIKCVIFTSSTTWNTSWTLAKTAKGGWANISMPEDRPDGKNCLKINADGNAASWTTISLAEKVAKGDLIMVYGGELSSWNQSKYYFIGSNNNTTDNTKAFTNANKSITIDSEVYKFGPAALPSGTYIQGHWASNLSCSIAAGSAYVVRGSTTKTTYYEQKANSGSDYLYQVIKQGETAPTTSLSPTCPSSIAAGSKLPFTPGSAGVSVLGLPNTIKYYLKNGSTYTEKTLSDGKIDVSELGVGRYSIITLLYDGYIYVKASEDVFDVYDTWALYNYTTKLADFTKVNDYEYTLSYELNRTTHTQLQFKYNGTGYIAGADDPTSTFRALTGNNAYFSWGVVNGVTTGSYIITIKSTDSGSSWSYKAEQKYILTYDANGATSGSAPTDANSPYSPNTAVTTASSSMTKTSFTLTGWNTQANGQGTHYNLNTSNAFNINSNMTLYAEWTPSVPASACVAGDFGTATMTKTTASSVTTFTYTFYDKAAGTYDFYLDNCSGSAVLKATTGITMSQTGCTSIDNSGDGNNKFRVVAGSAGDFTITATYNSSTKTINMDVTRVDIDAVASPNWYMIGGGPFGNNWETNNHTYPLNRRYRGINSVTYRVVDFDGSTSTYFRPLESSTPYGQDSGSDRVVATGTQYTIISNQTANNTAFKTDGQGIVWCIVDNTNKKFWVQSPTTYYTITLANGTSGNTNNGVAGTEGTITLTENLYGKLQTKQFASGDRVNISVTALTGYVIDDITIGATSVATDVNSSSYSGYTTMPSGNATLTVTYKHDYVVTFGVGTSYTSMGSVNNNISHTSGNCIIEGTAITFTATPALGYKFVGWYREAACSNQVSTSNPYATTITGTTTLYAKFDYRPLYIHADFAPNGWDTPVQMTQSTENRAVYTYEIDPLAAKFGTPASEGHHFHFVNTVEDPNSHKAYNYKGVQTPTGSGFLTDENIHLTHEANATIQFDLTHKSKITITLTLQSVDDATKPTVNIHADRYYDITYTASSHGSYTIQVGAVGAVSANTEARAATTITLANTPATGYHFDSWNVAKSEGTVTVTDNQFTMPAEDVTVSAAFTANSYTISFDADDAGRPGTATNKESDVTVTFDALPSTSLAKVKVPELAGYTFDGYYTAKDGDGEQIVDDEGNWIVPGTGEGNDYLNDDGNWVKAANTPLYAKWTALTYTVTFNATQNGGTCATASTVVTMGSTYGAGTGLSGSLPTPPDPYGYRFIGWYDAAEGGTKVVDETVVATDHDHTLYAHFSEITYVYFYNNIEGWGETVYVIFNADWLDKRGTGERGGRSFDTMERIGTSNIYRKEVPRYALEENWQYNIAFCNSTDQDKDDSRYVLKTGKAIYRTDFDSYATMFVPDPTETFVPDYENQMTYYSTDQWDWNEGRHKAGYWMKYNPYVYGEAGYVVKGTWDGEVCDFYFRKTEAGNSYTFTKWLPADQTYNFRIYKHCKTRNTHTSWFIGNSGATITSSISNWTLHTSISQTETSRYDHITTTIAGDYEFKITCNDNGTLSFSVTYPGLTVNANWYRLLYSWTDAGGSHSRVCETFQRIDNGGTEAVDAFIHKASNVTTQSLKLQKYVTVSSTPTWSDVQTVTLPSDKITKNGVYSFIVRRPSGSEASCSYVCPYEEDFFLRSDVTAGGWDYYKDIAFKGTQYMTYSDYSARQKTDPYSHYYCQYVSDSSNVAFTIATLTTPSICDTLVGDAIIGAADIAGTKYKHLPANNPANIRFMYNDSTNTISRAYLKSAQGSGRNRFLVLHGNTKVFNTDESAVRPGDSLGLKNDEFIFIDRGNWVYELNFKASPVAKAKVIAQYNGSDASADRYLIGGSGDTDADWKTILGAPADDFSHKYALAGTYDFKTNRLMVAWTPDGTDITAKLSDIDMLWVRVGDAAATQINFGTGGSLEKISAVGAIKINWSDVNGRVGDWNNGYTRIYAKYFVSFPFDVKVSDIFGLNKAVMGREYIIQKYNGAKRAKDGLFLGDDATFWETLTADSTMHANEGYLVMFDNDYLNSDSWSIWDNNKGAGKSIYLYFPADKQISAISNSATTTIVKPHLSKRTESWTEGGKTYKMSDTDSHWNLIGGPFFHNATIAGSTPGDGQSAFNAYYRYKPDNTWEACVIGAKVEETDVISNNFNAMSCFMVQWHGTLTWNVIAPPPASIVARRTEEKKNYLIQLDLQYGEDYSDHAFVDLKDGADSAFVLCEDMMKITRDGKPNVYVYAGDYDVAYSQVPVASQIVPVGVNIPQNGIYTFTMPTNFSGIVTLIDTYAQTRTNLALEDYEVYLERGTINDRFFLEININNAPTAIDGVTDGSGSLKDGKAHKFIMNDQMYILRDGEIFDARGNRVK